ncbi:MAG: hypothetical protein KC729_03235 [Candidatus Eisenbacteria bacterium]|uniref:T9SS type A sorting domain-containing protein n=1 Tax=Eiseniibacteriota bacterium TaxID=2212470 RepID=A0A956LW27_UNCEI|nr:hypothetical protein [Candidatus Eisenbacteria bacterium]
MLPTLRTKRFLICASTTTLLLATFLIAALVSASRSDASDCDGTTVGFTPLVDLIGGEYQGYSGGLYPGETNVRPASHEEAGREQAAQVVPRDSAGNPDPVAGKIGFVTIGMSNTQSESIRFLEETHHDPLKSPQLILIQGAAGGQVAERIIDPESPYWDYVDQQVATAGLTPQQVQVFWLKEANPGPTEPFPEHAQILSDQLAIIVQILRDKFPNGRLCFLSSRIYAGYASTGLNPEPYAYESCFSVRWLIEDQIEGDPALNYDPERGPVEAPWLSWAAYLWADGLQPRSDGLIWECIDYLDDGTHPSTSGSLKVANMLLDWIHNDTATRWYFAAPASVGVEESAGAPVVASPNPFRDRVTLTWTVGSATGSGLVEAAVFDARGRRIRTLRVDTRDRGSLDWNGTTDSGERVPAGAYWVQWRNADGESGRTQVLLLR